MKTFYWLKMSENLHRYPETFAVTFSFYLHSTPSYWFTKMSQCNTTFDLLWKIVKISAIIWVNPSNKGFWVIYAKSPFLLSSWCPNYKQTTNNKHWKRTTMLIAFKYWVDKNLLFCSLQNTVDMQARSWVDGEWNRPYVYIIL